MSKNKSVDKAQTGATVPNLPQVSSSLNESLLQSKYGGYKPSYTQMDTRGISSPNVFVPPSTGAGQYANQADPNSFFDWLKTPRDTEFRPKTFSLDEFDAAQSGRYENYLPGYDIEEASALGQSGWDKAVNGVLKGTSLLGTTFVNSTAGLIYGLGKWAQTGEFSSFYDNELTRALDDINRSLEDKLPHYYTQQEKDAKWNSPDYFFTGNFLWDGVVKNLGFAAGAALSGAAYTKALQAIPIASRLFAAGKAGEAVAAAESTVAAGGKAADVYGKLLEINKQFASGYNSLNRGGRAVVAGLATSGEASIESLHNKRDFEEGLSREFVDIYGYEAVGKNLEDIKAAAKGVGNTSYALNVGLLGISNYVQFPRILGSSYKAEKNIANSLVREIDDIVYEGGKYALKTPKYKVLSKLNKIRPYTFSVTEALEESGQFSVSVGTEDYYNKMYKGEDADFLSSFKTAITDGLFSDEGAKNALIGGISGRIMTAGIIPGQKQGMIQQARAKRKATAEAIAALNERDLGTAVSNFSKETFQSVARGTVLQQEKNRAIKDGDVEAFKNLEMDYIINYLTPRIKYGRQDLVKAELDEYRKLASTEEGFAQLVAEGKALETDTREAYQNRLSDFAEVANDISTLWQSLNLRYGSEVLTDSNGDPVLTKDGKKLLKYSPDVMNKMIYAATKVTDFDKRITQVMSELSAAGVNISDVVQSIEDAYRDGEQEPTAFNEAVQQVKDSKRTDKDDIGEKLDSLANLIVSKNDMFDVYEDIKQNPLKYFEQSPLRKDRGPKQPSEVVKVKDVEVGVGGDYYVGKIDEQDPISEFTVDGVNADGSINITTGNGLEKTISAEKFKELNSTLASDFEADDKANFYYYHKDEMFEYNFGKNLGGRKRGKLEYDNGKLYFTYLTPKGKEARKEVNGSYFAETADRPIPRIVKIGGTESLQQRRSRMQFTSAESINNQRATLSENRDSRLEVITELGNEAQESLNEINKKLEKHQADLAKIEEDLKNIQKMKADPKSDRIKLNFSKATKSFTKALNSLTSLQKTIEQEMEDLNVQKDELQFAISYFQDLANEITDMPGDSNEFLQELKNQVSLLVDNGKNLNKALAVASKLKKDIEKAIKSFAKMFRGGLKSKYKVDEDYSQYLNDLLDQLVSGENIETVWPLLKEEMANFALTNDLSQEATLSAPAIVEALNGVDQIKKDINDLRNEYKARKAVIDRFQKIADEYATKKAEEEKLLRDIKATEQLMSTEDKGVALDDANQVSTYEADSKKADNIIPIATKPVSSSELNETDVDKPHQIRANRFGINLPNLPKKVRDGIRGVFVTYDTQNLVVPAENGKSVVDLMLEDVSEERLPELRASSIIMLMVDKDGNPVDENGNTIPSGETLLDKIVFQAMPNENLTNRKKGTGEPVSMFRSSTDTTVKESITQQYKNWRDGVIAEGKEGNLSPRVTIAASFGQPVGDNNNFTPSQDAGLISSVDLEKNNLIFIPKFGEPVRTGEMEYKGASGGAFLILPDGRAAVRLKNRKHTEQEANVIADAIIQLAKNRMEPNGMQSASSSRLLSFLQSVVYWGIPTDQQGKVKATSTNSVFFIKDPEDGILKLILSNDGTNYKFTPSELQENREAIVAKLSDMYNNATSAKLGDVNQEFVQITAVSENGEIESVTWPNYQTYLLSNKNNKGTGSRTNPPLAVTLDPDNGIDMNRKGIYFYRTDSSDDFTPVAKETVETAQAQQGPRNIPLANTTYVFDGTTENIYQTADNTIPFTVTDNINDKNYLETINILDGGTVGELIEKLQKSKGLSVEEATNVVKTSLYNNLRPQIIERARAKEEEEVVGLEDQVIGLDGNVETKAEDIAGKPIDNDVKPKKRPKSTGRNREALRVAVENTSKMFEPENWSQVESWLKQNFPNVPVYRVKNIIQATNGRQAWGMFKDGAIYVYENAEVGTTYHEVFEAVYSMFVDANEKTKLNEEFKSRTGTFVDRPTGKSVKYSEATPAQIKEQLAEEFRDYIQYKKIPPKPKGKNFITRLFADIKSFIEKFFLGRDAKSNTEELFAKIGEGYYAKNMPYASQLSLAQEGILDINNVDDTTGAEFRLKVNERQRDDVVNEMLYITLLELTKSNATLFEASKLDKQFFDGLQENVYATVDNFIEVALEEDNQDLAAELIALKQNIKDDWSEISKLYKEKILQYDVVFDEEESLISEDRGRGDTYQEATKIDHFRKARKGIKLLMATLPMMDSTIYAKTGAVEEKASSIGGAILLPQGRVYATLMERLHDSVNPTDMVSRLRKLAEDDINYRSLYKRVTKRSYVDRSTTLTNLTEPHDAELITGLWSMVKNQSPNAKNVIIFEDGTSTVANSAMSTMADQIRQKYLNSIISLAKSGKGLFTYNQSNNTYTSDKNKLARYSVVNTDTQVKFLEALGIPFTTSEIKTIKTNESVFRKFDEAARGMYNSLAKLGNLKYLSSSELNMSNRLLEVAEVKAAINNPNRSSTFFIAGERRQSYIGVNALSELANYISKVEYLSDLANSPYAYLLTDSFSKYSNILNRLFASDGSRKSTKRDLLGIGYLGELADKSKGKQKTPGRFTFKERLVSMFNLQQKGIFPVLVPGDASLEYTAEMGTPISTNNLDSILPIFKGYFLSEVELSREDRPIATVEGRNTTDLRFFKDILGNKLHSDIVSEIQKDETVSADAIYNKYEDEINTAVTGFILDKVGEYRKLLENYKVVEQNVDDKTGKPLGTYKMEGVDVSQNLSEDALTDTLIANQANYMIANIEMHKLLFSDPYQYKGDELKRIKSFLSPREAIINQSVEVNTLLDQVWNKGFEKGDIGYTNFTQDHFNTASHQDIKVINNLPGHGVHKETDGSGIIAFKAHRNFRIRTGNWNQEEEKQYRYEMAWEKRDKNLDLSSEEQELLKEGNPQVKSAFTPSKPIVSGPKLGYTYNNVVLDKFALYPLSYRVMKEINAESNLVKLYNKMQDENIDYIVFESGRKVGAESSHVTYNEDGSFNDAEYAAVVKVPFNIISLQQDVPSKDTPEVIKASQPTKLVTLDYMNNSVPEDFEANENFDDRYTAWMQLSEAEKLERSNLHKEYVKNTQLLNKMSEVGRESVLKKLGIVEKSDGTYVVEDFSTATKTLREELFKRETNNNISKALDDFLAGKSNLEITPAYQQIRNILYSIVNKQIIKRKLTGGQKVQIPSALFESNRVAQTEINGKKGYTSDILKFYEDADGKRVMEVMVGRWFESDMSDKELLDYLNNTPEGQKILSGFAFRIPTQAQNSIDVFRIKQFLPKEFGDSVVVPASIVEKVGSDFDIDKLFMYFKSVYIDKSGNPKMIPFYGLDEKVAKKKFAEMYDRGELLTKKQMDKIKDKMANKPVDLTQELTDKMIVAIFGEKFDKDQAALEDYLTNTTSEDIKSKLVDKAFIQSIENEYIQSLENLVTNSLNFKRLTRPNSAAQLEKIADDIAIKVYGESFDYSNVGNMLDPVFMYRLRQAFLSGKKGIGIAAVNQTFKSQLQKIPVFIDPSKIENQKPQDRSYLGDGVIRFKEYNTVTIDGKKMASLSGVTNAKGDLISNINGQFVDGYVDISNKPFIILMGATQNVAPTFLFLNNIGVPIDQVAYFMNQPIIRDYLELIDANGYSWLFIDNYIKEIKNRPAYRIARNVNTSFKTIPDNLLNTVGKRNLNTLERAQQHFMLDEFLKYAKMASQSFTLNQGINWDTSRFNDPLLITRKQVKLEEARNTIFSTVGNVDVADALINDTFLSGMVSALEQSRNALGTLIPSDEQGSNIQNTIQQVVEPYARNIFSEDDFIKVARKLVADVFDYAVQTNENLNTEIQSILLDKNGVVAQAQSFIKEVLSNEDHPMFDNLIVRSLESSPSREAGNTPNNLMIGSTDNKTYDQNNIIYSFRELRDYLEGRTSLYDDIVQLSILQSGVSPSPISFTALIPYEDVERIYGKVLSNLGSISNLAEFKSLGVFERNNWRNSDIVPQEKARWIRDKEGEWVYNPQMRYLPDAYQTVKAIAKQNKETPYPEVISVSSTSRNGNSDYIFFSWDNMQISKATRKEMRDKGDFSYINRGLFQKIKDADGNPVISNKGYFYYKQINAWGDGFRAKEFYPLSRQSVIDNGTLKVENEMSNESLIPFLSSTKRASRFKTTPFLESTPAQPTQQTSEVEKVLVDKSTLKDGDVVYDKYGTKFIYRGVREEGKTGAGSPRLERTDGSGEIAIPGINIKLYTQPTQQVSEVDFDKLKEEAKKKGVPIFDLKDWTLKEPIQNGETTITHIIPDPTGGNFKILFDRPTGQWMAKFNLKDGVVQKALFKNEGTKSEPSMISSSKMSEDFMDKSISAAIPADLIASITEDLKNVPPQTDTKLNTKDFAYTESIDKKYGIKKTLGDILQSTTTQPTQQNKPEGLPAIDRTSKKC